MTYTKYDLRKAIVSRAHALGYMGDDDNQTVRSLASDLEVIDSKFFKIVEEDLIKEYKIELEHIKEWDI